MTTTTMVYSSILRTPGIMNEGGVSSFSLSSFPPLLILLLLILIVLAVSFTAIIVIDFIIPQGLMIEGRKELSLSWTI